MRVRAKDVAVHRDQTGVVFAVNFGAIDENAQNAAGAVFVADAVVCRRVLLRPRGVRGWR